MTHRITLVPRCLVAMLLIAAAFSSNAQEIDTTGLYQKQIQLKNAKKQLEAAEEEVKVLTSEVEALQPWIKWTTGGFQSINFNQISLTNWSKGGQNSLPVTGVGNLFANYKYDKWTWDNNLDVAYGLIRNGQERFRKNEDKIDLVTRVGRRATEKLSWAAGIRLESQFAPGFDDQAPDSNQPMISRFLSPGYMKTSLGMEYKPNNTLTVFVSPITGKFTIVMDDEIAERNIYIPESAPNDRFRSEFGALVSATYRNNEIVKNVGLRSSLELFNNYTDPNKSNRQNIDVDWQTIIDFKIGKYIGANLFTHLLYDDDTKIIEYNEEEIAFEKGPRIQFKEVFGLGFSYKF